MTKVYTAEALTWMFAFIAFDRASFLYVWFDPLDSSNVFSAAVASILCGLWWLHCARQSDRTNSPSE